MFQSKKIVVTLPS